MKVRTVHISPGIYFTTEEDHGKSQLMKAAQPVIASNQVPYLRMTSVGSLSSKGREGERDKEK